MNDDPRVQISSEALRDFGSVVQVKYAGFWRRAIASWIDGILLFWVSALASGLLLLSLRKVFVLVTGATEVLEQSVFEFYGPQVVQILSWGVYLALSFFYFVWFHYRTGATWGKRLLGVRVVNAEDSGPLTVGQSIARTLGYVASYLILGLGYLWVAVDPKKRGLHDGIARTRVVLDRS